MTNKEIEKIIEQTKMFHGKVNNTDTLKIMIKAHAMEKASNNIANALDRLNKTLAAIYEIDITE